MTDKLIFAIPKGRILDDALPYIEAAGLMPEADFFDKKCRALRFATARNDMDMIRVRAFDVASFVAHGAAHIGIVGSDVIEEFAYSELYAPVDLNFGHCRLSVARRTADADSDILDSSTLSHIRIATKYPNITKRYFAQKGIQAECVKLNGAMELAPSLGLSRHIVDLVEIRADIIGKWPGGMSGNYAGFRPSDCQSRRPKSKSHAIGRTHHAISQYGGQTGGMIRPYMTLHT